MRKPKMSLTCAKLRCFSRILRVDRIERLLAAEDLRLQLGLRERLLDVLLDPLDEVAAVAARLRHRLRQRRLAPGLQVLERELLQLAVGLVEAEPVRDRRVDVERLGGDARRCFARSTASIVRMLCSRSASLTRMTRTSRVIASSILRNDSACDLLARREAQLVELGQAVDEVGGRRAEALDQLGLGDAAILHRVVHQRGHDRLRVELPFGAQARDGDRVRDVGLARGAELAEVRFVGEAVGVAHASDVGGVEVVELDGERGERRRGGVGRRRRMRGGCRRPCAARAWRLARRWSRQPWRDVARDRTPASARIGADRRVVRRGRKRREARRSRGAGALGR